MKIESEIIFQSIDCLSQANQTEIISEIFIRLIQKTFTSDFSEVRRARTDVINFHDEIKKHKPFSISAISDNIRNTFADFKFYSREE